MKPSREERLRRIEQRRRERAARRGEVVEPAVVVCPAGALPDEFAAEQFATGARTRSGLFVPPIPQGVDAVAAWERVGTVYQAWLLRRGSAIADGADTSQSLTPREAYRRAIAGEPLD